MHLDSAGNLWAALPLPRSLQIALGQMVGRESGHRKHRDILLLRYLIRDMRWIEISWRSSISGRARVNIKKGKRHLSYEGST